jgi:hypothetical protein
MACGHALTAAASASARRPLRKSSLLDYDIIPIVEVEKAVELLKKAIAFRKG